MPVLVLILVLLAPAPALAELMTIDPADYPEFTELTSVTPGALITSPVATARSFDPDLHLIGRSTSPGSASCCWFSDDLLRVSFDVPTDFVEVLFIRGISDVDWTGVGIVSAYDDQGQLLETATTDTMDQTDGLDALPASVTRGSADVSYVLISENHSIGLDGIRVRMVAFETPEPSTLVLASLVLGAALLLRS